MINVGSTVAGAGRTHLKALDGWRGVACLLILFYHTGFNIGWGHYRIWGSIGVHLFFVLSGFLIFLPFCTNGVWDQPKRRLKNFYVRRFARIYPPYFIALVVFSLARYLTNMKPPGTLSITTHVLLIFNWFGASNFFGINVVFWTLAIEVQFYLLLPLAAWAANVCFNKTPSRAPVFVALSFLSIGLISRAVELASTRVDAEILPVRFVSVFSHLDLFAWGMIVAVLRAQNENLQSALKQIYPLFAFFGTVCVLAASIWWSSQNGNWQSGTNEAFLLLFPAVICSGIAAILFLASDSSTGLATLLRFPPLVKIGTWAYGMYLFHTAILLPLFPLFPLARIDDYTMRTLIWGGLALGPSLIIAALVFRFVEVPSMTYASDIIHRMRSGPARTKRGDRNSSGELQEDMRNR